MLTSEQVRQVIDLFEGGQSPEETANELGMARNTLVFKLLEAGKRIKQRWHLEDVIPVDVTHEREGVKAA